MSANDWIELLCWIGCPSVVATVVAVVVKVIFNNIKGVKLGVQALLRAQMIHDYNKWSDKGYAPIYARQNFENCWKQYHSLGANGVMDDIHKKFLELPTNPPEEV